MYVLSRVIRSGAWLLGASFALQPFAFAQSPDPAMQLCKTGKYAEALPLLERASKDAVLGKLSETWNCLSLAYIENKDLKAARKAIDRAAKLAPATSVAQTNLALTYLILNKAKEARNAASKAISIDATNGLAHFYRGSAYFQDGKVDEADRDAETALTLSAEDPRPYVLKSRILMERLGRKLLKDDRALDKSTLAPALESLERGLKKTKNHPQHKALEEEYDSLAAFSQYFAGRGAVSTDVNAPPEPGVTPLKILTKPRPGYTDNARMNNIQGRINLLVLFGASGRIERVMFLNRLGGGLDQQVLAAASRIAFEPMKRNGQPVPVVKRIEYTFEIY